VILANGLAPLDLAGRCRFEIAFNIGMECRLVVLHGQKIVDLGSRFAVNLDSLP
jgi:hypothetical protein